MRNLKKFLALVLALVMAFSLMVTANAANPKTDYPDMDSVTEQFQEAVDVLSGMGVFRGNNGSFLPQNKIMRCEAVAILYRLVTGDVEDKQVQLYAPLATYFNDVDADDWFAGYVGYCVDAGYIKGYNGDFNPYTNVTGYEMLAMLLRAVGYGKNGEFTGVNWRINVGTKAQELRVLANIESTHYANTLSQASPREVVADLTFQVATLVPTVIWQYGWYNPYVGVPNGDGANVENPTLGERVFGLTGVTSVIVGNEATGESATRLGIGYGYTTEKNTVYDSYGYPVVVKLDVNGDITNIINRFDNTGAVASAYTSAFDNGALKDGYAYLTTTSRVWTTSGNYEYSTLNSLFDYRTGLDQFAHEVTVWFDGSHTVNGTYHTYALIDHVTSDTAFFADDNTVVGSSIGGGVTGAKKGSVMWSDRYSQIGSLAYDATTNLSPIATYRKVVNPNGTVYIALSAEVADIAQKNTTTSASTGAGTWDPYLILGSSTANQSDFGNGAPGQILLSQLTPDTKEEQQKVGETVTAWQIVGTSFDLDEANTVDADSAHNDNSNRSADIMYQLDPMVPKTITVSSLQASGSPAALDNLNNPVTRVFTTSGDELKLSGITLGNGTNSEIISQALPVVIKTADATPGKAWNIELKANTSYIAYMDIVGRFISMVPVSDYQFLYGTYAGYDLDGYDAGTIKYNMVGVDWNAKIQAENTLKSLTLDIDTNVSNSNTHITGIHNHDGEITDIDGKVYNKITTTKKDLGVTTASVGNEILNGYDTGYMYNASTGDLAESEFPKMVDDDIWEITAQDAVNGFKKVNIDQGGTPVEYLLTKDTHFIVVSGTGTATLKVAEYNGLTGLLNGATSAQITYDTSEDIKNEVIFQTEAEKYGTMFTTDNGVITDVILSDENLFRWNIQTLYFDFDQTADTGMVLPGTNPSNVKQYNLWNNGQMISAFVDITLGNASDLELSTGDGTDALFFTLAQAYEVNGTPVYMALKAPAATGESAGIGGLEGSGFAAQGTTYDYVTVSNLHTGLFADSGNSTELVLSMENVTVCDVQWKVEQAASGKAAATLGRGEITNVLELNNAVSVGKLNKTQQYTISVAVVYDTSNASAVTVYVLDVT